MLLYRVICHALACALTFKLRTSRKGIKRNTKEALNIVWRKTSNTRKKNDYRTNNNPANTTRRTWSLINFFFYRTAVKVLNGWHWLKSWWSSLHARIHIVKYMYNLNEIYLYNTILPSFGAKRGSVAAGFSTTGLGMIDEFHRCWKGIW